MARVITLFNHKGGVGKTTLCYNLAYSLAKEGLKVSIIDGDSQGNLTGFFAGFGEKKNNTLSDLDFESNRYLSVSEHISSYLFPREKKIIKPLYTKSANDNILQNIRILCGGIQTSMFDLDLIDAIQKPNSRATQHFPSAFKQAIYDVASIDGGSDDVILIDLSPSLSIFNMLMVMLADYFIVPVSPGYFSLQAVQNLTTILREWRKIISPYEEDKMNINGVVINTKFLGIVLQNYNIYDSEKNPDKVVGAFDGWSKNINSEAISLVKKLIASGDMAITEDDFRKYFGNDPYFIGKIPRFNRLSAMSEHYGLPVTALTRNIMDKDIISHYLNNDDVKSIENFNNIYTLIAQSIASLIKTPPSRE